MTIYDRLKVYLNLKHLNVSKFESLCGLSNGSVVKLSENTRSSTFGKIASAFPELNINWLRTGEGEMIAQNSRIVQLTNPDVKENVGINVHMVPLVPIEAMAGSLVGFAESAELSRCRRIPCPDPNAEFAIQVSGDSMVPEIESGTFLFIKKINESVFIPYGHTLVMDTENGVVVKKIFPSEDKEYLLAKSVNPVYPPFNILKSSIYGIYRIVGKSIFNTTI